MTRSLSLDIQDTEALHEEWVEICSGGDKLSWISPIDGSERYREVLKTRQAGTGTWFLNTEAVQKWRKNHKQLLYCPGIPGAGKTVLSSIVIEWLGQSYATDDEVVIAYHFFDFRREPSVCEILAAILRQIWQGAPKKSKNWPSVMAPKEESIKLEWYQSELEARLTQFSKTFIILDALDECSVTGRTLRQLLDFLFGLQRKANVNILATSRVNGEIANLFQQNGASQVEIQADEGDIRAYVEQRAAYFSPFVSKRKGLLSYIQNGIVRSSRGM